MTKGGDMRRRCFLLSLALPMLPAASGCSSRRFGLGRGVPGPMGAEGATIGRNLHRMPAGRAIPPTGLGVDLVDSHPAAESMDGRFDTAVEPASGGRADASRDGRFGPY
jgi:hypothetical protein